MGFRWRPCPGSGAPRCWAWRAWCWPCGQASLLRGRPRQASSPWGMRSLSWSWSPGAAARQTGDASSSRVTPAREDLIHAFQAMLWLGAPGGHTGGAGSSVTPAYEASSHAWVMLVPWGLSDRVCQTSSASSNSVTSPCEACACGSWLVIWPCGPKAAFGLLVYHTSMSQLAGFAGWGPLGSQLTRVLARHPQKTSPQHSHEPGQHSVCSAEA